MFPMSRLSFASASSAFLISRLNCFVSKVFPHPWGQTCPFFLNHPTVFLIVLPQPGHLISMSNLSSSFISLFQQNVERRQGCKPLPVAPSSALAILQGCGLHPGYYDTIEKAAEGVRDIISSLRSDLHDPPHDIQCAVLRKLGVEGFTKEGVAPTHKLIPLPNA
jgi:hypothetical protein